MESADLRVFRILALLTEFPMFASSSDVRKKRVRKFPCVGIALLMCFAIACSLRRSEVGCSSDDLTEIVNAAQRTERLKAACDQRVASACDAYREVSIACAKRVSVFVGVGCDADAVAHCAASLRRAQLAGF